MHIVSNIIGMFLKPTLWHRCRLVLAALVLLLPGVISAQTTYPVQVNAHLLPPYSLYLSDYYSGTREKITVTLINRDQFKPTLSVRLRLTITAPGGVRLQTNDNAYIEPLTVEAGMPLRLTQEDLEPYFRNENIVTQGYLPAGKLPEGIVEFCFQAVEAYTGRTLSASNCTRAFITSQKPPLLSLPLNNENIAFREPLNLLFQWTPRHQGLAMVEYEFILKELWDNGMTVQAAFAYSPEIYRETTRSTSLPYGAVQPALLPGKRYAWCIRAQAREGTEPVNVFQNDGYSEVRTFALQDNCAPPGLVNAVAERKTLQLEWPPLPEHIGFTVSYRIKTTTGTANPWKEIQSQDPKTTLYGLQSGGVYEYRVGGFCVAGQPVYTPILEATIPATDSARLAQCGIMPAINLTNHEPIKELKTGEVIMANDYPVTITKISGSNGVYTGEGWVIVPWLNDAKIAVDFTSITINTDRQMIAGYIDAKYDKKEGQIANLDEVFEGGFDVGSVKAGITKVDHEFDFSIPGVEAFSLNDEGDLVITDDTGEPHTVTAEDREGQGNEGSKVVVFPMTVKDKNGNVYQVEKVTETDPATGEEKEVAKATFVGKAGAALADGSFDPNQLDGDKAVVTFDKGSGTYAFDTWQEYYANVSLIKEKYGAELWQGYHAPWKFLPAGGSDVVRARIAIKDTKVILPEKVIFKTPKGTEFASEYHAADQTYTVKLAAGPEGDAQEIYALFPKTKDTYYTLGKLSVATYPAQAYTVVLVPVNDAPVPDKAILDTLKATYGPIAVTWTVRKDDNFAYTGNYRLMESSTGLSTYNADMKALNDQYRAERAAKFEKAANYLFFLKATGSDKINDRDFTGFMPRGAQIGYIFTSEIPQANVPVTVAHELGHGRWKLFHTFDEHYGGYKRGETDNLMDYKNGSVVAKWQWDIIGDPAMLVSVFEGDDASAATTAAACLKANPQDSHGFLTVTEKDKFTNATTGLFKQFQDYTKINVYILIGDPANPLEDPFMTAKNWGSCKEKGILLMISPKEFTLTGNTNWTNSVEVKFSAGLNAKLTSNVEYEVEAAIADKLKVGATTPDYAAALQDAIVLLQSKFSDEEYFFVKKKGSGDKYKDGAIIPFPSTVSGMKNFTVDYKGKTFDPTLLSSTDVTIDKNGAFDVDMGTFTNAKEITLKYGTSDQMKVTLTKYKVEFGNIGRTKANFALNKYGYDDYGTTWSDSKHHVSIERGQSTYLHLKLDSKLTPADLELVSDPVGIASVGSVINFGASDEFKAELRVDPAFAGNAATVYARVKGTTENLAYIDAHVWDKITFTSNLNFVYDSRRRMKVLVPPAQAAIQTKMNDMLKSLVAEVNLVRAAAVDVPFDVNGNKTIDYYINAGPGNNYEVAAIRAAFAMGAQDALVLENYPQAAIFFSRTDYVKEPNKIYVTTFGDYVANFNATYDLEKMDHTAGTVTSAASFKITGRDFGVTRTFTFNFNETAAADYLVTDTKVQRSVQGTLILPVTANNDLILYVRGLTSKIEKAEGVKIGTEKIDIDKIESYNGSDWKVTLKAKPTQAYAAGQTMVFWENITLPADILKSSSTLSFVAMYTDWQTSAEYKFTKGTTAPQIMHTTATNAMVDTQTPYYIIDSPLTKNYAGSDVFSTTAFHIVKQGTTGGFNSNYDLNEPVVMLYVTSADQIGYTFAHEQGHGKFLFKDVTDSQNVMECKVDATKAGQFLAQPFTHMDAEVSKTGVLTATSTCDGLGTQQSEWKMRDNARP